MKINQVEELVGITKKNIRFYEEQELIAPKRNPENGYREYSLKDVEQLNKIKFLRKLDVSIEQIRKLQKGELSLSDCMEKHLSILSQKQHQLELTKEICHKFLNDTDSYENLDSAKYLEEMERLEEGGAHFMDVEKKDVAVRRTGAWIAAIVVVAVMASVIGLVMWANSVDAAPIAVLVLTIGMPALVIVGVVMALMQRLKELKGGEADEASKY